MKKNMPKNKKDILEKKGMNPAEENNTVDKARGADAVDKRRATDPVAPVDERRELKTSSGHPYTGERNNIMSGSVGRELRDRGNI